MTKKEIDNILFELDEALSSLRLTEDEYKFAAEAVQDAFAKK